MNPSMGRMGLDPFASGLDPERGTRPLSGFVAYSSGEIPEGIAPEGLTANLIGDQQVPNFFPQGVSEDTHGADSPGYCADPVTNNHNKAPIMTSALFTLAPVAGIAILAVLLWRARLRLRAEARRELLERIVDPERGRAAVVHRDVEPGAR